MEFKKILWILIIMLCFNIGNAALSTDIVSYWTYDNILTDSVSSNDFVNSGATYTASGKINGSYTYTTNDVMYSNTALSVSHVGSISAWIKPSGTATYPAWFGGTFTTSAANNYIVFGVTPSENLFVQTRENSITTNRVEGNTILSTSAYSHVVITSDGSSWELWVNGVNQTLTTSAGSNTGGWFIDASVNKISTGAYPTGVSSFSLYWEGGVDEVAIWDKVLTSSEISQLYNSNAGLQYPFNLDNQTLTVNILNITANGVLFVNDTTFNTTSDITFNTTYEVLNSDIGNFTNSSVTTLTDLANGVYYQQFEVCYNSTCDTSINYTYTVNISRTLTFENITVNGDTLNPTGTTYFNVSILSFDVDVLNTSTNGNVNQTYYLYNSTDDLVDSSQYATNNVNGTFSLSGLPNDIYKISFYADNGERTVTSTNYSFEMNVTTTLEFESVDINGAPLTNGKYFNTTDLFLYVNLLNVSTSGEVNVTYFINGYTPNNIDLTGNQFITDGLNGSINFSHKYDVFGNMEYYIQFESSTANGRPYIDGKKVIFDSPSNSADVPYGENETAYNFCNKFVGSNYQLSVSSSTSDTQAYFWNGTDFELITGLTPYNDFFVNMWCEIFGGDSIYNITLFADNGEINKTVTYTFTIDTINPSLNVNLPAVYNSYSNFNFSDYINYSDTNINTCIVTIVGESSTTCNNTNYNFTTNGNKTITVTATDLAGNTNVSSGNIMLISNNNYFRFYDVENAMYVENFTFNGYSSVGQYVTIPTYDLGLGAHSLQFKKTGYGSEYFNFTFTTNSNLNKTYNVSTVAINVYLYYRTNNTVFNVSTVISILTLINGTTSNGSISFENSSFEPGDYTIQAISNGYYTEQKVFTYSGESKVDISLYLLNATAENAGTLLVNVQDELYNKIPNSNTKLLEYDLDILGFREVGQCYTNGEGQCKFLVEVGTKTYKITSSIVISGVTYSAISTPNGEIFQKNIVDGEEVVTGLITRDLTLKITGAYSINYLNGLYLNAPDTEADTIMFENDTIKVINIPVNWTSTNNIDYTVCIKYYWMNHGNKINFTASNCSTSSAGSIGGYNITLDNEYNYQVEVTVYYDDETTVYKTYVYKGGESLNSILQELAIVSPIIMFMWVGLLALALWSKKIILFAGGGMFISTITIGMFPNYLVASGSVLIILIGVAIIYLARVERDIL